jgi:acetoin utilization deacetylase AcuC-like enzyme
MGIERVLIFDWDVHHGNGTQDAFYEDSSILYMSTHQSPLYPGSGRIRERGSGKGAGYTINIPLPPDCGDEEYLYAVQEIYTPVVRKFDPGLLIVSAGFDAHRDDPLASQDLSTTGFIHMSRIIQKAIEDKAAKGKMVCMLEGGYNLSKLADSVTGVMEAWYTQLPQEIPVGKNPSIHARSAVEEIKAAFPEWFG